MNYEELLNTLNSKQFMDSRTPETPYFAIRAVVELHKPQFNSYYELRGFKGCEGCEGIYPCPTIQAIEREIG